MTILNTHSEKVINLARVRAFAQASLDRILSSSKENNLLDWIKNLKGPTNSDQKLQKTWNDIWDTARQKVQLAFLDHRKHDITIKNEPLTLGGSITKEFFAVSTPPFCYLYNTHTHSLYK